MSFNLVANAVSLVALSTFTVFVFGRPNSLVHVWPQWRSLALKVALGAAVLGHGLSAVGHPLGVNLLSGGLALVWVWAAVFHYQHFVASGAFNRNSQPPAP